MFNSVTLTLKNEGKSGKEQFYSPPETCPAAAFALPARVVTAMETFPSFPVALQLPEPTWARP